MIERIRFDDFFGKSIIATAGMGVSILIAYLYHLVMVRMLPASTYGDLSTLVALMVIVSMPILSVQALISREIAKAEKKGDKNAVGIVRKYLKKSIVFGLLASFIFSLPVFLLLGTSILSISIIVVLFSIPAAYGMSVINGYFQGKEKVFHLAALINAPMVLRLILSVIFVYWGLDLIGATISFPLGYSLVLIPLVLFFGLASGKEKGSINLRRSFIQILSANILMIIFIYCDLFIVRLLLGAESAAYYNTAEITAKIPFYVSNALVFVLMPQASKLSFRDSSELLKRFLKSLVFILPFAPAFILLAHPLLSFFYNPTYADMGSEAFKILSVAMVIFGATNFIINILWSQKKEVVPLALSILIIPIHLGVLYILVPGGGLVGAATATLISTILFFIISSGAAVYYSMASKG
ncbi:MAG: oligosaccharide flippase family protein [Candidatus Micrarchaeota archaeon]